MASTPVPAKSNTLHPDDWVTAAFARLAAEGIEAVRVEVLARDLGVSKGSFYWHFRDREDLLEKMLTRWEHDEAAWLESAIVDERSAAARWARLVERSASPENLRAEVALRDWARRDPQVANRIAQAEQRRASFISSILREIGFSPAAAKSWSEVALLVSLGWLDRASRAPSELPPHASAGNATALTTRTLGEFLSDLILAASR